MTKKILAALMALTMCAGFAGCGKDADKDTDASKAASSAAADKEADSSADEATTDAADSKADDAESKADKDDKSDRKADSDSKADAADSAADGDNPWTADIGKREGDVYETDFLKMRLVDNIICVDQKDLSAEMTDEELKTLASAVVEHFNTSCGSDMQAFIDNMGLGLTVDGMVEISLASAEHMDDENYDKWIEENMVIEKYNIIDSIADLLIELGSDEAVIELSGASTETNEENMTKAINTLYDSVNAKADKTKENLKSQTLWDQGNEAITLSDNATFVIYPSTCGRDGDDLYTALNVMILDGDNEYDIMDINAWIVGGKVGMWAGDFLKTDNYEEYKGMDTRAIFEYEIANMFTDIEDETESAAE